MAKMVLLGAKNPFFWPEINFLEASSNCLDAIMAGHKEDNFFVLTASHGGPRGGRWGLKTAFLTPKKATLGNRGHKTARRADERPSTGKPKVSRVTSGCGEVMIPLSRIYQSPRIGCYMGVA